MKITVCVPQSVADEAHRHYEEEIEIAITDTISDVKVKTTLVFTELNPEQFYLSIDSRRLANQQTILKIKQRYPGNLIFLVKRQSNSCCEII